MGGEAGSVMPAPDPRGGTVAGASRRTQVELGPMPTGRRMSTVDHRIVHSDVTTIFDLASRVDRWPEHLRHYRFVRFRERAQDGGGLVEMSAVRPFGGPLGWPTWWLSEMRIDRGRPAMRFRHVGGITTGMDVEWSFEPVDPSGTNRATLVRIVHVWDGPRWPIIGARAATMVIGPLFIHGIASRTLQGLALVAERDAQKARGNR